MSNEIPLNPISREQIHKLESTLLFATLFRPEVLEIIRDPAERLTWVDSLAVAAGSIAREKAMMSVGEIARELGRTEQTIRKHLKGESKAGQLVRETYELLKQGKLNEVLSFVETVQESRKIREEVEKLKKEKQELEKKIEELKKLKNDLEDLQKKVSNMKDELERIITKTKEVETKLV
ncbi:MAG: hypothetical protein QFX40_07255 [Archaeoglobales archaeon]|nr:hypothetical protein [Archaeoglobales archaeon]